MSNLYAITSTKLVYKISFVRELDSNELAHLYEAELVGGWEYINPDENNVQGYVSPNMFIESVQYEQFTHYPLSETLEEALADNDMKVIDISTIKIHEITLD